MNNKKTAGYVAVCGITIALNIVFIMMLAATPVSAYSCTLAVIVMTPAMAKFGWKKAFPVYIGTALLGALFMEPELAMLYFCTGFQPFGADTDVYVGKNKLLKLLFHCVVMGTISSVLLFGLGKIFGIADLFEEDFVILLYPAMILLAFFQGVIYRSTKGLLYNRLLKPILDEIMR